GMYCRHGNEGIDNNNANDVSQPLYNLTKKDWWMHHENRIDLFPPAAGDFLELRAGGYVTLELSVNRAFTTTSENPILGEFPNGQNEIFPSGRSAEGCVTEPNLHTKSEAEAAGTVLAISYANTLDGVSSDNLGVISVAYKTPWRRLVNYSLPMMPTCSDAGCHCAWGWVPTGCGRPDMYMQPFKCKVTNGFSIFGPPTFKPAKALPPVWCQDDPSKCIVGPKQMIYYNQLDGNNVNLTGVDNAGNPKKPAYDMRYGWADGTPQTLAMFVRFATHDSRSFRRRTVGLRALCEDSSRQEAVCARLVRGWVPVRSCPCREGAAPPLALIYVMFLGRAWKIFIYRNLLSHHFELFRSLCRL
ncbi:hypothetical protein DFP72DRAFT_821191, partial [Ephemerocybe angulata]